ncbi:MAG: hypothetical protein JWN30_2589 [Bacilli bacterium]|nr:hypothetical protein [Bacilli bacterium]
MDTKGQVVNKQRVFARRVEEMTADAAFYIVLTFVVICLLIWVLTKGRIRIVLLSTIAILTAAFLIGLFNFIDNIGFRRQFDIWFHPASQYININTNSELPLPSRTAVAFRTSESSYAYYTNKSQTEVYSFYKTFNGVSIQDSVSIKPGTTQYKLTYAGHEFSLFFMTNDNTQGCVFIVTGSNAN